MLGFTISGKRYPFFHQKPFMWRYLSSPKYEYVLICSYLPISSELVFTQRWCLCFRIATIWLEIAFQEISMRNSAASFPLSRPSTGDDGYILSKELAGTVTLCCLAYVTGGNHTFNDTAFIIDQHHVESTTTPLSSAFADKLSLMGMYSRQFLSIWLARMAVGKVAMWEVVMWGFIV